MNRALTPEAKRLRKLARAAYREERQRKLALVEAFCQRELGASLEEVIRRQRQRMVVSGRKARE